jgi:NodT family efflux transporter outer membrane factor (OMF) lipoprotein
MRHEHSRTHVIEPAWIVCACCVTAGCQLNEPPGRSDIQQQALGALSLRDPWRAAPVSSAPIQDNWLATFGDDQLSALVAEALDHNLDLRIAATRVEQATLYVNLAEAALRPAIGVLGTGGLKMGGGSDITSALQGIALGISWEPDLWGRLRYGRNAAREGSSAVQADFEFARQSLAATTARTWFTAAETSLQLQLADDMVRSAQELVTLAEDRHRVGSGSEQDAALARANLGSYQDSARQIRLAHEQTLRALEVMLGRYPSAELESRRDLPTLTSDVPTGVPLDMLDRRPDMIAAERRIAAAFNRVGEAKAARLPRFILNVGAAALESDILVLKQDFENPVGSAGGKLMAPIYTGGALKTQVEIRTSEQKAAVLDYARSALNAIAEVEKALAAGQTLQQRAEGLKQVVEDNQRALQLARTSYQVGQQDLRSVQQQQLAVYAASVMRLRVQSEELAQRINLHLALGGSFEDRPAVSQPLPSPPS